MSRSSALCDVGSFQIHPRAIEIDAGFFGHIYQQWPDKGYVLTSRNAEMKLNVAITTPDERVLDNIGVL